MLTGQLQLVRRIGEGAMGVVWVAHNHVLGAEVAVKILREVAPDSDVGARFGLEARAVARLGSPYVANVFDTGVSAEGEPYIVMELLRGEDLAGRIDRAGPLDLRDAATLVTQLGSALGRAHEIGLVHRDIKPANLFLVDTGGGLHLKVLDFGVAKHGWTNDLGMTGTGVLVGTPYYMSPEQLLDPRRVDHRADLWAAAVVAYTALTGRLPFHGETLGALSVAVHARAYPPPASVRHELPPAIDAWMARAFARELDARFQRAGELAEAFVAALDPRALSSPVSLGRTEADRPLPAPLPTPGPLPTTVRHDTKSEFARSTTPAAPPRGVPGWVAAVLGGLALVSLVALGTVGYFALADRSAAQSDKTSSGDKPAKKKTTKKKPTQTPADDADETSADSSDDAPQPTTDLRSVELPRLYEQVIERVRKQRPDAELVAIAANGVDDSGRLAGSEGTLTFEFRSLTIGACVTVMILEGLDMQLTEGECMSKFSTIPAPRCSFRKIRERLAATLPRGPAAATYITGIMSNKPEWNVIVANTTRVLPDDC
jgi:serine/threonine protein kinase